MLAWLSANLATVAVAAMLAAIVAAVIWYMIAQKKKGISSCGCDCGGCAMSGSCHSADKKK